MNAFNCLAVIDLLPFVFSIDTFWVATFFFLLQNLLASSWTECVGTTRWIYSNFWKTANLKLIGRKTVFRKRNNLFADASLKRSLYFWWQRWHIDGRDCPKFMQTEKIFDISSKDHVVDQTLPSILGMNCIFEFFINSTLVALAQP